MNSRWVHIQSTMEETVDEFKLINELKMFVKHKRKEWKITNPLLFYYGNKFNKYTWVDSHVIQLNASAHVDVYIETIMKLLRSLVILKKILVVIYKEDGFTINNIPNDLVAVIPASCLISRNFSKP